MIPVCWIAYVVRKEHLHLTTSIRKLRERSRDEPGARGIQHSKFFTKNPRNGFPHRLPPTQVRLCPHTIVNDRTEKSVSGCCSKSIVSKIPVHVVLVTQTGVNSQAFKRKDTPIIQQLRET